ncbi:MAG: MucBP domain-containing protein [Lachnospiraceae bacterium]|nr:MucBP domain-containing protein [Lachnospiraceae bacterium]
MNFNKKLRKVLSMFLAFLMFCSVTLTDMALMTSKTKAEAAMNQYGLLDKACDGLILHCWNWSYSNIKSSMADIAAAGYTSLQTSPVQMPKDAGNDTQGNWWKVYQPTTLSMVENHPWFGSKAEFKAMCDEAEKYGIKVIVDIVANHMANNTGSQGNCRGDICSQNDATFRDDDSCWHLNGSTYIDYGNQHRNGDTTSLTHGFGGWPDLNTGNTKVQNAIISLLKECVDLGADGFRFDAAKHIELPTDPGGASDFWPNVTSAIRAYKSDVYLYGEILDDSATSISNYTKYLAVTDNRAGNSTRYGVRENNIGKAANSALTYDGQLGDNIVLWSESHDTYANDNFTGESAKFSQDQINRAWCIIAARDFAALYYIRPGSTSAAMGSKSTNTAWKDTEIVAVNKFHNYFNGTSEYMSSCDNSVVLVERGSKTATGGVVLVNIGGGSKSVSGATTHLLADGTYKDQVSGSTFTVSGGKISGQIGNTGVAVVYNAEPIVLTPTPTISKEGGEFSTDTLSLTIGLSNATSGTYKIGSGSATTYTSSKSITIGSDMSIGDSVTITLTATDGSKTTTKTYTFTKTEYIEPEGNIAYLKLPSGWSTPVKCYAYDSATETVNNGVWPGQEMTLDSETGYYKYEVPSSIEKPRVIFYSSDVNRYPADMEKGLLFEEECPYLYKDGSWSKYSPTPTTGTVVVKYVDGSNNEIATSKTTKGTIGSSYTTTAATVDGYTLKTTPSNATGKYTAGTITVTYVYEEIPDTDPKVTTSLASGSTFKTETQTITLTLANATSGTYSVDDGPVKTFTSTASVVLGQGKVADSTVTVKATAKGTDGTTKSFTFTYNKQFNGTINEETSVSTASLATAKASSLASYYSTNENGVGVKKTITVDGSLSDWDSSMLIAQGTANDDPRVYRPNSMYEVPIDLYALYGAYDDSNLYLMWEMTNVQDVVAPNDDYPLSQGVLYQTMNVPFFIAIDTKDSKTAIGNKGQLQTTGTIWDSGITFENSFNRLIAISTNGANGPFLYEGDSTGLNPVEIAARAETGIEFDYGLGILSKNVYGIDKAYGEYNNRVVGDMCNENAAWVDFNTKGHSSSTMDFHYEMAIPFESLGVSASDVASNGLGVLLIATMGKSGMDCLPYDLSMNDQADLDDAAGSQEFNSFEKSDEDHITTAFAGVGKIGEIVPPTPDELELNFGADKSSPQATGTALTLNGIAEGGTAPYTYKYYVNGSLVGTKSGSGETSVAWTPSTSGKYLIKCIVTDADGNSKTSAKYYNIEGNSGYDDGWVKVSNNWYYYVNGKKATGWKLINTKYYYFDASGVMQASKWVGNYYLKSDGVMATSEFVGDYYVDENGVWVTGSKWLQIDGKYYYLAKGVVQKSKWAKVGSYYYYFDASGVMQANKWISNKYYVKSNGVMATSEFVGNYYVDANGVWVTGTKWVKVGDDYYYLVKGVAQKSKWVKVGTKYYYFDASGVMQANKWISNKYYVKADGSMATSEFVGNYYVNASGAWVTGTQWAKVGDDYYYLVKGVVQKSKWVKVGTKYYYFNETGVMQSSKWIGNYYVKADGSMAVSEWVDNGKYYVGADGLWVKNP